MKQVKLTKGPLLTEDGNLAESGYAFDLVKEYERDKIKANKLRIKEWDYYYIGNEKWGIALTIADNSYMGLFSVSFLHFEWDFQKTKTIMTILPKGKTNLPSTSTIGDVEFENKTLKIEFKNDGKTRHIMCKVPQFEQNLDLECDIVLEDYNHNSMVIATPFEKPKHFYYNQKINCLKAKGYVKLGSEEYSMDDALGVLDWGRGVWTYKNTWYWSSLSANYQGHTIGFNLGYGFGINENATENMFYYDDKSYKLDEVIFNIPKNDKNKDDFLATWTFTSNDEKLYLEFIPVLNRKATTNALVLKTIQNQVFGKFSGYVITENGDRKSVV